MPRALVATGMELEYDSFGSPDDPTLLLVMGFTAQMIQWDEKFCQLLADTGLHVVRFDNRDCGLSSKLDGITVDVGAVMAAAFSGGELPPVPYTLSDMAADGDRPARPPRRRARPHHRRVDGRHDRADDGDRAPDRVRSLTSVMSTTGDPAVGQAAPEVLGVLLSPPADRPARRYIEDVPKWMAWQSKKYRDAERTKALAAIGYDRSILPARAAPRQMAAIVLERRPHRAAAASSTSRRS